MNSSSLFTWKAHYTSLSNLWYSIVYGRVHLKYLQPRSPAALALILCVLFNGAKRRLPRWSSVVEIWEWSRNPRWLYLISQIWVDSQSSEIISLNVTLRRASQRPDNHKLLIIGIFAEVYLLDDHIIRKIPRSQSEERMKPIRSGIGAMPQNPFLG